jgi:hypothetical protein
MRLSGSTTNRNQRDTSVDFPPPWWIEEHEDSFIVKDDDRQALGTAAMTVAPFAIAHFLESQQTRYEEVANEGKTLAEKLKVSCIAREERSQYGRR